VLARTCATEAARPGCGVVSRRVHSRYQRKLADTASGGHEVLIHLQARRFFCGSDACAKATFAEQVPGLTVRYGRRTCGLDSVLQAVALALGGRAGARLSGRLACSASRSTLLRLVRAAPDPDSGTPLVLGVDDFAPGRGMSTARCWWTSRPAVPSTCSRSGPRSRSAPGWMPTRAQRSSAGTAAAATPEGAAAGAPLATQVADRWHLWHNLAEAVERAVARHRSCLQEPPPQPGTGPPAEQAAPAAEAGLAARTRARHAEVHAALARGLTITEISRTLRLERKTVRRYATAATPDQLISGPA
jgi:transposase